MHRFIGSSLCVGLDSSPAELALAAHTGASPLVRALAADLPLADGAFAAVVCSMSLQILQPLDRTLREVARVLRPGGVFVALLPANAPLSFRDRIRYARLLVALRRSQLGYPNDGALAHPVPLFQSHGLDVVSDERYRFVFDMSTPTAGDTFVRSLYLPGSSSTRLQAAACVTRRWHTELGIPLRRIVATRPH